MARDIVLATDDDIPAWLTLAAEVEPLFGPMVEEPGFLRALRNNIARGSAYCIRVGDGQPGSPLDAGLLWSESTAPLYKVSWLAVTVSARGQGLGESLVRKVLALVTPPATVSVVTFGADIEGGQAARRLYERLGFIPEEMTTRGPEGGSRQIFRLRIPAV